MRLSVFYRNKISVMKSLIFTVIIQILCTNFVLTAEAKDLQGWTTYDEQQSPSPSEPDIKEVVITPQKTDQTQETDNLSTPLSSIITGKVNLKSTKPKTDIFKTRKVYSYKIEPADILLKKQSKSNSHLPDLIYQNQYTKFLFKAVSTSDVGAISTLLKHNADINATVNGVTPLIIAIIANNMVSAKYLILKGANINLADENGQTPLHYAAKKRNYDLIKLLLKYKADFTIKDVSGRSAFDYLPMEQNVIFSFSVLHNVKQFNLALIDYASKGIYQGIELALYKGADVNTKALDGNTALMLALQTNADIKIIQLLLKCGADPSAKDINGLSALDYAILLNNNEAAVLLETYATKLELDNDTRREKSIYDM